MFTFLPFAFTAILPADMSLSSHASADKSEFSLCHLPSDYFPNTSSPYPTVFLVRHGESEYNHMHSLYMQYSSSTATATSVSFSSHASLSAGEEPDIVCPDAPLTQLGHKQATALRQQLTEYDRLHVNDGFGIDVLICSPLTRAIQTCLVSLADYHQQYYPPPPPPKKRKSNAKQRHPSTQSDYIQTEPVPVLLHPSVAEHCYCMSDVGRPLSALLPLFSHFEFDTSAFEGRQERWWYGADGRNGDVWRVMKDEYPDVMERELLLDIAKAEDPDEDAEEEVEEEKAQHQHAVTTETSTNNSPKNARPSRHAHMSPAHVPHTDDEQQAATQRIRLHPQLVQCEGEAGLVERLGGFVSWLCERYGRGVRVCVVCHSQVIATLGQGWLQNAEMVQLDWEKVPRSIMKRVKAKAGAAS